MKFSLPTPHSIAIYGLSATFLISLIARPLLPTLFSALILFTIAILGHLAWKRELKWDIFMRDTFVSTMVILLLLEPATSFAEILPVVLVMAASIVLRAFVRYK